MSLLCLLQRKRRHEDGKGRALANGGRERVGSARMMKDRIRDGHEVVKEMNGRESVFSYCQLSLQMCIK